MVIPEVVCGETLVSEWKISAPNVILLRPSDWRKEEFLHWTRLLCQGYGIAKFGKDKISNSWSALPLRVNVCAKREFLAQGRQEIQVKIYQYCPS